MRVGLMTREYPPNVYGGAGVHVEYLSLELAKKIEVEVHCWGTQEQNSGNLHVHGLEPPPEITDDTKQKFKAAVDAFALNLAQMKELSAIDIVHTHTWYVSMAGFLAKKLYNVPFVLTTHSLEPLRAWKAEQLGSGYALSSWMERTAIHDADAIIAVSNGTKADIVKAYPEVQPDRIHVIYNGIDLDQYQYTEDITALKKYGVDPARPYVLFVGRITRQKGVTHLVEAIPHMPAGTQVVLCAGAPDTPEIAAEIREMIEALRRDTPGSQPATVENFAPNGGHSIATGDPTHTGHNIVWIEQMVTKQEAIQLYSHCAVFCCPSVYEPFGIINLEAMACKAPVVASATGGILEVVVEGETGHLVPFEADPKTSFPVNPGKFARDLAVQVTDLLNDPAKAKRYGEAGRKRVEENFAWSAIADQTIALYRQLVAKRKK
ncbi:MAG: alpha-maltose-phosphate synthase [Gammaproteobacteria bacterium]|jgi:starch synthase|nr:alpha-maltose-phosphate synthase [Gammaproteobacteria bacterium]